MFFNLVHMKMLLNRNMQCICIIMCCLLLAAMGCAKKETLSLPKSKNYYPQEIGKYVTYRLDSTVIINSGQTMVTRSYQVRDLVDAAITDNQGRPAFRIRRMIRDTAGTQAWQDNTTFVVTAVNNGIETWENGLRYIKLKDPVRNEFSWKGNAYIDTYSLNSELKWMDGWNYTYENVAGPFRSGVRNFSNTITVAQRNEILGNPNNLNSFSESNIAKEVYALGIGLVYKELLHLEYQPPAPPRNFGFRIGFGIKLQFLETNW